MKLRCKICGLTYTLSEPPTKGGHYRNKPAIGQPIPCEAEYPKDWFNCVEKKVH